MSWLINRARSALDLDQYRNLMAVIHVIASDLSCHGELYQSEPVFAALDALSGNAADTPRVRAVVATETQIDPDTAAELWQGLRDKLNERIPERFRAPTLTVEQLQKSTAGASGSSVLWPIIDGGSASRDVDLGKPVLALTGSARTPCSAPACRWTTARVTRVTP